MVILAWTHYSNTRNLLDASRRVEHTWQVVETLDATLSALEGAETGQGGFLLTGETVYLKPYEDSVSAVPGHLNRLRSLTSDDPTQKARLRALEGLVAAKLEELAATIRLFSGGDTRAARQAVEAGAGRRLMDQIRQSVGEMRAQEQALLARRTESAKEAVRRLNSISVLGAVSLLLLLAAFLAVVRRDLLGKARAVADARDSEEQLRTTLRSIGDAVLVTGADGLVTFLNPVAERLTGWMTGEALGRPVEEVFRIVNEESRAPVENPIRRVIREGAVAGLANHTILISRDGSETPISDSGAPILGARGEVSGVVVVFRDISEQRRADRAIHRLVAIVASSKHAIIAETLDNVITDWNPGAEALLGFAAAEMIGRRMADLGLGDGPDPSIAATQGLLAGGPVSEFDVRRRRKDGRWVDLAVSLSPIHANDGTIIGISRLVRDVTERRRQSAELIAERRRAEEANAAKDRFLATLSHELRTPLTPVMASVHRLERRPDLPPGVAESLAMIRRNVELEARLIDDLLDLTRIARGKLELERAPLDLHEVIRDVVQNSRSEFFAKSVEVDTRLEARDHYCVGDTARLQQAFWNLLKNSVKFTPPGGRVTIRSENPSAGRIRVRVADTGQGIRPELLPRLFEAFEQGDSTAVRRGGGLGLGLSIARQLIELHEGAISAASEGEGRGAEFTVELATTPERPRLLFLPHAGKQELEKRNRTAVLVVEDDVDSGTALHELLVEAGFDASIADSVATATTLFRERPADVLVTDIGLPDGSGLELLGSLRAMRPGLRAIVVSGYGMEQDVERSLAMGVSEHLVKPLNFNRLIAAIDRLSKD